MAMSVRELKDALDQLDEEYDDLEVRLMTQESWPFENSIESVTTRADVRNADEMAHPDLMDSEADEPHTKAECVFLVEGEQYCYGSKNAWGNGMQGFSRFDR